MSQDFIIDVPTELLCQVFGYLERFERETAAAVCTRWSDIISRERYVDKLELKPHHLVEGDIDALKHFRSISVLDFNGLEKNDSVNRLKQFLNNETVMSNVEELHIEFNFFRWTDIFSSEKELRYPQLRRITLKGLEDDDVMNISRCIIIAPRLKVLQTVESSPIWLLSDQIETLVVESAVSLNMPGAELFPNLRSLTLDGVYQVKFDDSFKTIMRQLKELKLINVRHRYFRKIFDNARDIESLSIFGMPMSAEVYAAINILTKLKQLSLINYVDTSARGLSLPCLEKLTILPSDWPPLENVPNLRSLCIHSYRYTRKEHVNREKMADYFRPFGHQLHRLTVTNLVLSEDYVNQICSFNNLQILKICRAKVEYTAIEKIFHHIRNLKLFRLQSCTVVDEFIPCDDRLCNCDWCMGLFDRELKKSEGPFPSTPKETITPCFSKLRSQYVDCAITTTGSCLTK